ncbi:MAG: serine hydrolase [Lachnospiraceae bacterium]|nr:serine hydrolase [Lachnospiraceae bacterium]
MADNKEHLPVEELKKKKKKDEEKTSYLPLIIGFLVCVVIVVGLVSVLLMHFNKPKKASDETTEFAKETAEEATTEEATTEQTCWFEDKDIIVPTMTNETISLNKADLSVFDQGKGDINSVDLSEGGSGGDPWQAVTLTLDSVPGSINLTSPGESSKTEQLTSTYMCLVDAKTGDIVAERDGDKVVNPASMTKVLTVLTARDYIDPDNLDDKCEITAEMLEIVNSNGLSAVGFRPGNKITVRDLLYGTIVCSGADAALGLATYCCGSEEAFVEKMNENAEKLGISDTAHFTNCIGIYNEDLHCTMQDMTVIMSVAVQDPLLLDVLSKRIYTTEKKYPKLDLPNGIEISNWFLRRIEDKEFNGQVVGAKTGFVNESMFCAVSYYKANDGREYVCATGNAYSSWRAIYDHTSIYRSLTQ